MCSVCGGPLVLLGQLGRLMRFMLAHVDQPYDPPSYTPEQMDALVAWWLARRSCPHCAAPPGAIGGVCAVCETSLAAPVFKP